MKFKKIMAFGMALCLSAAVFTGCGNSGGSTGGSGETTGADAAQGGSDEGKTPSKDTVTLKLSIGTSQSSKDIGNKFKEELEAQSEGRILVDIYADNQLGGDREVAEATQYGDIDICLVSTTPVATSVPNLNLFDAPFIFPDRDAAYSILDGEVGQAIAKDLETKVNTKVLGFPENGFRCLTNNKVEVHSPADLKGIKIRVMESEIHMATWSALGASPTPMAFTELFTALQQKTIDAQENPMENNYANRFYEVQEYCVDTYHVYTPFLFGMNLDKFNSFSTEDQELIAKVGKLATDYQRERAAFYEEDSITKMEEYGTKVVKLTDAERAEFRNAVTSVYDLVKTKMDTPELLDQTLEATTK